MFCDAWPVTLPESYAGAQPCRHTVGEHKTIARRRRQISSPEGSAGAAQETNRMLRISEANWKQQRRGNVGDGETGKRCLFRKGVEGGGGAHVAHELADRDAVGRLGLAPLGVTEGLRDWARWRDWSVPGVRGWRAKEGRGREEGEKAAGRVTSIGPDPMHQAQAIDHGMTGGWDYSVARAICDFQLTQVTRGAYETSTPIGSFMYSIRRRNGAVGPALASPTAVATARKIIISNCEVALSPLMQIL